MEHLKTAVDLNRYPEAMEEIIRHMDFMADDYNARKAVFWFSVNMALFY